MNKLCNNNDIAQIANHTLWTRLLFHMNLTKKLTGKAWFEQMDDQLSKKKEKEKNNKN